MKKIELTQGYVALIDDEDYEAVSQYLWHVHKTKRGTYARRGDDLLMHRFIMKPRRDQITDHQDGNGLNNRRGNLRVCTVKQNNRNARKSKGKSSKYKGVSRDKRAKKWQSYIVLDRKFCSLGRYDDEMGAAWAYDVAAMFFFEEFAKLNFPLGT